MLNQYSRTELLFGKEAMEKLWQSRVAVFGIGGVGGYAVEALARSGIGALDLIDDGHFFGKGGSGFERVNMACPRATLKEALDRLLSAVKKIRNGELLSQ